MLHTVRVVFHQYQGSVKVGYFAYLAAFRLTAQCDRPFLFHYSRQYLKLILYQ